VAQDFDARLGRAVARWLVAVDRRSRLISVATAIVSVVLGAYAALNLGVNSDQEAMLAPDVPFLVRMHEFQRTFRNYDNAIFVVIDAENAVAAARAASRLAERLGQQTQLFSQVDSPDSGPFFERNQLLFLDLPQLEDLADRVARAQPLLAELSRDASVAGISDLLRSAIEARGGGSDLGMDLAGALDGVSVALEASAQGRPAPDPWGDALIGGEISEAGRHRLVAATPKLDFGDLLAARPAVDAIRAAARELGLDADHGIRVRVTGDPVLNYEEQLSVDSQAKQVGLAAFVLFTIVSWIALPSLRILLALVGSLLASIVLSNAFAAAAVGHLNQISAAFNVLVIALGGEFGIHFCMHYAELAAGGRSRREALEQTGAAIGGSLISSAGTTSIGFLVFLPTDYRGVAELGLISCGGIVASLFCTLTVLPALLALGAPERSALRPAKPLPWARWLEHLPLRFARPIRWTALALALGALCLLPRAHFDYNHLNLRDPNTESVQAFQDLLSRAHSTPWTIDAVAPDLDAGKALAKRFEALPTVERAITVADYVPSDQAEKRAILADTALFLPTIPTSRVTPSVEVQRAALERLAHALANPPVSSDAKLAVARARLREAVERFLAVADASPGAASSYALLSQNMVGSLPDQLNDFALAVAPEEVSVANLPPTLRDRMLSPEGRARIEVFPKGKVEQSAVLDAFVDSVQAIDPGAVGYAGSLVGWGRVTVEALRHALLGAVGLGAIFLLVLWRNPWDTLLAFFPLGLAALFICALLVLVGQPFNFANVIVLPMLLGMGVDSGVHLVHQHRTNPDEVDVLATSTARAVFFSAVMTIASFASLGFVSHRGMAALGQLLTLGVFVTLVCYVVVLPAVLEWDDRRRHGPR
jgi:hypothetical protein